MNNQSTRLLIIVLLSLTVSGCRTYRVGDFQFGGRRYIDSTDFRYIVENDWECKTYIDDKFFNYTVNYLDSQIRLHYLDSFAYVNGVQYHLEYDSVVYNYRIIRDSFQVLFSPYAIDKGNMAIYKYDVKYNRKKSPLIYKKTLLLCKNLNPR